MTHTGYQDQKRDTRRPDLPTMLSYVDHGIETLGLKITWPEVNQARAHLARAEELRTAYRERTAAAREQVVSAGTYYAAGDITAAELIDQATAAAVLEADTGRLARQMVEAAAVRAEAEGAPLLYKITEARWLKVLRPVIAARLAEAQAVADELGIREPRPQTVGVVKHGNPWAPDPAELRTDMALRHKWERLEAALDALDDAYRYADTLRAWGFLPMVEGRRLCEDYRWLRVDRLAGDLSDYRVFFLANRADAEPGIYTAQEMAEVAPPRVQDPNIITDRYNAAVAAQAV